MADYYVDLTDGSDSNNGTTVLTPFKTFAPINSGGFWLRGNRVLVKRGSRGIVDAGTRANIECNSGAGRLVITTYGDVNLPLPVIDGAGTAFNPFWIRAGSAIDVSNLHVTNALANCMAIEPPTGSSTDISDVTISDCIVSFCGQGAGIIGVDGLRIGSIEFSQATVTNIRVNRVVAKDNGGHGIKVRGYASDVIIKDCIALRNGYLSPSHGMGTSGSFVQLAGSGWTNISGNVWEKTVSVPGTASFDGSWTFVHVLGAAPIYSLYPSSTPATPGPGEVGFGAANTIRINLNGVNPNTVSSIAAHFNSPDSVWFVNCVSMYTVDSNGIEGQGIYFDSGSFRCFARNCVSAYNEGHGYYTNQATNCSFIDSTGVANGKGAASSAASNSTTFLGMVLDANGLPGVNYNTGNALGLVLSSKILNASVGITSNDIVTNTVQENRNQFIACTTRLQNVSDPGADSVDLASELFTARGLVSWANKQVARAEALI